MPNIKERYPEETLSDDDDDGTMPANVEALRQAVVGHRIIQVEKLDREDAKREGITGWSNTFPAYRFTLDNGRKVRLHNSDDCCAYTELEEILLNIEKFDHMILGVGTTDGYETWHVYADFGDVMQLKVGWSCGNPFYYGYGFHIAVEDA